MYSLHEYQTNSMMLQSGLYAGKNSSTKLVSSWAILARISFMKDHNLIQNMLDKSRLSKILHGISMLINDLFHQVEMILKKLVIVLNIF